VAHPLDASLPPSCGCGSSRGAGVGEQIDEPSDGLIVALGGGAFLVGERDLDEQRQVQHAQPIGSDRILLPAKTQLLHGIITLGDPSRRQSADGGGLQSDRACVRGQRCG
jgi:hypothetical protein